MVGNVEWIKVSDRNPDKDGYYLVAWWEDVNILRYTTIGGWNTHIRADGSLSIDYAIPDGHILAWSELPDFPKFPKEGSEEKW